MKNYSAKLGCFRMGSFLIISSFIFYSCSLPTAAGDSEKKSNIREINNKIRTEKKSAGASYKPQYDLANYNITRTKKQFDKSPIEGCLRSISNQKKIVIRNMNKWRLGDNYDILSADYDYKYMDNNYYFKIYIYYYEDYESCSMGMGNELFSSVVLGFQRIDNCLFDFCFTTTPGNKMPRQDRFLLWANIYAYISVYQESQLAPLDKATDDYFNWFQKDFKKCMLKH